MPNRWLWVGIPLLALTFAAGAYVVRTNHCAPKQAASTGATKLTADVMDSAKSCCATQDPSTKTAASVTTQLTGASSQPNDGKALVECDHADKGSCDQIANGGSGKCPADKTKATRTKLAQSDGVPKETECPATGAALAKTSPKSEPLAKPVPKAKTTTVAEMKVASATK